MAFGLPPQAATATEKPRPPKSELTAQLDNQNAIRQKAMAEADRGAMGRKPPPSPGQMALRTRMGAPAGGMPPMDRPPPSPGQMALRNQAMTAMAGGGAKPPAPVGGMGFARPNPMMGGAFGMRTPPRMPAGAFGSLTKAPMSIGTANPFAGAGATRIPGDR